MYGSNFLPATVMLFFLTSRLTVVSRDILKYTNVFVLLALLIFFIMLLPQIGNTGTETRISLHILSLLLHQAATSFNPIYNFQCYQTVSLIRHSVSEKVDDTSLLN